ncbi:ribonuclease PH [SAR202 cluster bacterium AD-804-J14_MRT_500m]|nr:ribonuclease PH [SAR202 cluster bacterium AD-804-J14_MRT_500m]
MRIDGRRNDEIRKTGLTVGYQTFAEGSVLIEMGNTKVICSATIEERVPGFLRGENRGWVTSEYAMLPRSTLSRSVRDVTGGSVKGRHHEIQRLIGRSLRAVTDLSSLGERTVVLDCDVLQADGGTRTAAITGGYVALNQALGGLVNNGILNRIPLKTSLAAISVGLVDETLLLDLCYEEDFRADVDFNFAMTGDGRVVEIQATGEGGPFDQTLISRATDLAAKGIDDLISLQQGAIASLRSQMAR